MCVLVYLPPIVVHSHQHLTNLIRRIISARWLSLPQEMEILFLLQRTKTIYVMLSLSVAAVEYGNVQVFTGPSACVYISALLKYQRVSISKFHMLNMTLESTMVHRTFSIKARSTWKTQQTTLMLPFVPSAQLFCYNELAVFKSWDGFSELTTNDTWRFCANFISVLDYWGHRLFNMDQHIMFASYVRVFMLAIGNWTWQLKSIGSVCVYWCVSRTRKIEKKE